MDYCELCYYCYYLVGVIKTWGERSLELIYLSADQIGAKVMFPFSWSLRVTSDDRRNWDLARETYPLWVLLNKPMDIGMRISHLAATPRWYKKQQVHRIRFGAERWCITVSGGVRGDLRVTVRASPEEFLTPQALRSRWDCCWSGLGPLQNGVHRPFPSVPPPTSSCWSLDRRTGSLTPEMTTVW